MEAVRVHQSPVAQSGESASLRRRHVGPAMAGRRVPHVPVLGGDVEVAAQHQRGGGVGRVVEPTGQPTVPRELGLVEHRADRPSVRRVERDHANSAAGRGDHPCLGQRLVIALFRGLGRPQRQAEVGHHIPDPGAGRDRHAVPLSLAVMLQLVPRLAERRDWRLGVRQLGLLHEQHVRARPLEPPGDLLQAGLERVHVPGGDPHGSWARRAAARGSASVEVSGSLA